jgi:hypothetical protein
MEVTPVKALIPNGSHWTIPNLRSSLRRGDPG